MQLRDSKQQLTSLKKPLSTSSRKRADPFGAQSGCTSTTIVPVLSGETFTYGKQEQAQQARGVYVAIAQIVHAIHTIDLA
jgi:hypothetical protein